MDCFEICEQELDTNEFNILTNRISYKLGIASNTVEAIGDVRMAQHAHKVLVVRDDDELEV